MTNNSLDLNSETLAIVAVLLFISAILFRGWNRDLITHCTNNNYSTVRVTPFVVTCENNPDGH